MAAARLMRSFLFLWLATGLALFYGSVETVRSAFTAGIHFNPHLVVLASIEAVAAILFVIPRMRRFGAIGLLITLFIAFGVHTSMHEFRGDLVLYAAAVTFVVVHGPLTREQLRVAFAGRV